ncbi:uncharacterized protein LOC114158020 isoform X1 [Xiphophorus couchianus]|uniref:uncharacterized protein LOC114158020 isoform X1 n=1 Tax=Xiphophorus couchianus TaxID=32473 RepID=UPI001016C451|nr:uncharacterized protein LOC114158020 isoform X1 [Xiphophorus couchianus]XP_027895137.1 uncharacterized protein LOC114158020 isoform X1 [Xiphophorus couchianus]XP_027895142.1 uncharacterized protein LOC114158020 isoform X1 [Xiphophorus couchianus]XP_027895151.1 uncharacterized protein LOC114158020 isoform X1 [Xiphophorus couchianus]
MVTSSLAGVQAAAPGLTLVESLTHQSTAIPDCFQQEQVDGSPLVHSFSEEELRQKQTLDPAINAVIVLLETGETPCPSLRLELPELPLLLRELSRLEIQNGILYRKRKDGPNVSYQLVLPEALRATALRSLHHDMGHLGVERTVDLARTRFYWPKMYMTIDKMVKACERCVRRKTHPEKAAPLMNIKTYRPLELVCIDFSSIEPDRANTKDILVITDHFTKYAVAIPTQNQRAQTIAKCLWENFIVHYGFPEKLLSDQGADFESKTIKELCELIGMRKVRTTPYHPRGNPVERFNRTLLQMLGTLDKSDKLRWKDFVKPLVHAYNCTKSDVTGFSPYELMFGRQPRLPIDLIFRLPTNATKQTHSQYVGNLKSRLEESYRIATSKAGKNASRNKARFDRRVIESTLQTGDRVLVRNVKLRGKHKLADKWEEDVYIVLKRAGEMPVYTVKPESKDGPVRTLHRDLLLPCGFLSVAAETETVKPCRNRRPRTRQRPVVESEEEIISDLDDVPDWTFFPHVMSKPDAHVVVPETHKLSEPPCAVRHSAETEESENSLSPDAPTTQSLVRDGSTGDIQGASSVNSPENVNSPESVNSPKQDRLSEANVSPELNSVNRSPQCFDLQQSEETPPDNEMSSDAACNDGFCEVNEPVTAQPEPLKFQTDGLQDAETSLRRSQRVHTKPNRLDYVTLGNPLMMVVNSLFQGLSDALTSSLNGFENVSHNSVRHP